MSSKLLLPFCFSIYCAGIGNLFSGETAKVSPEKISRSSAHVPVIRIGLPFTGKRKPISSAHTAISITARGVKPASTIDSEFTLGEVYVYPNPAKGGQIPTFHIESGIADSVKIMVYSVAGDVVHNHTITSPPTTTNDGHGLEYAYEYSWRGHIPSGVYYYAIEAQKGAKKLRRTGKFAVIR